MIILLDIMMPDIDGYEVIRILKESTDTQTIPVIFVSALGNTDNETRGLELRAVDYISKPFTIPVVLARIRTQLKLKELRENLAEVADERTMELNLRACKEISVTKRRSDLGQIWPGRLNKTTGVAGLRRGFCD